MPYYRDEPFPMDRIKGIAEVRHLCVNCVLGIDTKNSIVKPRILGKDLSPRYQGFEEQQLILPLGEQAIIHKTQVRVVNITRALIDSILNDYDEIYNISPENFEYIIQDRLNAMGMDTERIGRTNRKDGGIDVVFWPQQPFPMPFLGAAQIKHHRSPHEPTRPRDIRDMSGVMSTHPFQIRLLITNTTFTADARWFAEHQRVLLRLRDMYDLRRWIASNFLDEAEWREMPMSLELCPGITIDLSKRMFRRLQNV
jgi:hypothetical protein